MSTVVKVSIEPMAVPLKLTTLSPALSTSLALLVLLNPSITTPFG